jgi:hypothetical protein
VPPAPDFLLFLIPAANALYFSTVFWRFEGKIKPDLYLGVATVRCSSLPSNQPPLATNPTCSCVWLLYGALFSNKSLPPPCAICISCRLKCCHACAPIAAHRVGHGVVDMPSLLPGYEYTVSSVQTLQVNAISVALHAYATNHELCDAGDVTGKCDRCCTACIRN